MISDEQKEKRLTSSEIAEALDEARWAGYYSGKREVVEWLGKHNDFNELGIQSKQRGLLLTTKDWQALRKKVLRE